MQVKAIFILILETFKNLMNRSEVKQLTSTSFLSDRSKVKQLTSFLSVRFQTVLRICYELSSAAAKADLWSFEI